MKKSFRVYHSWEELEEANIAYYAKMSPLDRMVLAEELRSWQYDKENTSRQFQRVFKVTRRA
jgi:hypothetical protein